MDYLSILSKVDHTLLNVRAGWNDIEQLCKEAIKYKVASVCIPPSYVKQVKMSFTEQVKICTVIGFPNGYNTTKIKVAEAIEAISNGADEIDMVINLGMVNDGNYDGIKSEIQAVKKVCGDKILKVIIETCLLTDAEKIKMCEIVTESGADYIKTSTGFSKQGATFHDIEIIREHIGPNIQIKAAGGISSLEDAEKFISLGVSRLGSSRIIKLIENSCDLCSNNFKSYFYLAEKVV